ncbi:hypothetical protein Tco_0593052 [Tanacetum coccineum]
MSEPQPLAFCVNGCKMTKQEKAVMAEAEVAKKNMSKRVARLAKKVYEGKSEEEKRPTDFQADDDAIMMGKGVTMKKALNTSN